MIVRVIDFSYAIAIDVTASLCASSPLRPGRRRWLARRSSLRRPPGRASAIRHPSTQARSSGPADTSITDGRFFLGKRQQRRERLQKERRLAQDVLLSFTDHLLVGAPVQIAFEGFGRELAILEARLPGLYIVLATQRRNLVYE